MPSVVSKLLPGRSEASKHALAKAIAQAATLNVDCTEDHDAMITDPDGIVALLLGV